MTSVADFDAAKAQHAGFVVLVYAPWCGHSRALLPEVEKASETARDVPFFKVDGTEADALATHLDVKGYPTLLFVRRGDGPLITYEGVRQARPIADWAAAKSRPSVQTLATAADVRAWTKGKPVALVLFAADGAAAPEAEALTAVAASAAQLPCAVTAAAPSEIAELAALGAGELAQP